MNPNYIVHNHSWWTYETRINYQPDESALMYWRDIVDVVLYVAQLHPNSQVLEVPCGNGFVSQLLADVGRLQVTGIDISRECIEVAQYRCNSAGLSNVSFICADASRLPLSPEYDAIFVIGGVGAINNGIELDNIVFLQTLAYALKPQGKLIIQIENYARLGKSIRKRYFESSFASAWNMSWYNQDNKRYYSLYYAKDHNGVLHKMTSPFQVRYFSPTELTNIVQTFGLKVRGIFNGLHLPISTLTSNDFEYAWLLAEK